MTDLLQIKLSHQVLIFDGAIGTELYKRNFFVNTSYEGLCLTQRDVILDIHRQYADAGAEVMTTTDLVRLGSERDVKAQHLIRQEPKDYVVQDDDILLIRFSV